MKRGAPLRRKKPLSRGQALKRGTLTRTPIDRTVSKATRRYRDELDAITPALIRRSGGQCELQVPGQCKGQPTERHHRKMRSQGGPNTLDNLLFICEGCHGHVHAFPRLAYHNGWLVQSHHSPRAIRVVSHRLPPGVTRAG